MPDTYKPAHSQNASDAGAREAFAELVTRYHKSAIAYAYALLKDHAAAEDATQAAFLTAWLHRNDLREPRAFIAWLRAIVRSECSRITRRQRLVTVPIDASFTEGSQPWARDARDLELRDLLLTAIKTLPDSYRAAIALRYMGDCSYQEMCGFLRLPLSTVKKRLHSARQLLRARLMVSCGEERTRQVLRRPADATPPRLKERIMQLADFLESVGRGDTPAVAAALDVHPEWLDASDDNELKWHGGLNALAVAAASGQAAVAELLLARGAQTLVTAGCSPIAIAAVEGHRNVVDVLRQGGLPVDVFAAAAIGDADHVAVFVDSSPELVRERTYDGKTALHFCRSVKVAETLLAAGAEIDPVDDAGRTPLQWISATGSYKAVCRFLIAQGARANASDIFWACAYGDLPAVLRFLEADGTLVHARRPAGPGTHWSWIGRTPLHEAAMRGETDVSRALIDRGADVNASAGHNVRPLHLAACGGHREVAELLLAANAEHDVRDTSYDATPEEWAQFWGHTDLAAYLGGLRAQDNGPR